jgi:nucleoside-diphosphate-sugar epimerase
MTTGEQIARLRGTVLVTGASGFLGSRLVDRLRTEGATTIVCTTRALETTDDECVTWRPCDLTEPASVRELFVETRPTVVFHLASHVSGARDPENVNPTLGGNLVAAVNVLLASLVVESRRVVLAGSYEEPKAGEPPRSPYAAAKAAATGYARMFASLYGLSTVVLRPAMIYGPGQRDVVKLIPYVTRCFLNGEVPALSSGHRPIDWVYVDDVVEAFVTAAVAPGLGGDVIDIGSGRLHTVAEIVRMLAVATDTTIEPRFGGMPDRAAEHVAAADTETARRVLGWTSITSLEEGLARTVDDVRATLAADRGASRPSGQPRRDQTPGAS